MASSIAVFFGPSLSPRQFLTGGRGCHAGADEGGLVALGEKRNCRSQVFETNAEEMNVTIHRILKTFCERCDCDRHFCVQCGFCSFGGNKFLGGTAGRLEAGADHIVGHGPCVANPPAFHGARNFPRVAYRSFLISIRQTRHDRSFLQPKRPTHSNDWLRGVLSYGDIGDHYVSPNPNAPLVIHIQDAHGIKDAQQNISSMMGALQVSRGVNLVGVEGAAGTFNLAPYRGYPAQVVKDVADFFLDRGLIVGSEYAGLTLPKSLTLYGVEQGSLYAENVTALRESYAARSETRSAVDRLQGAAQNLKQKIYSPALLEYDKHLTAYKAERESLSDFVKFLAQTYKLHSKAAPAFGANVAVLLDALNLESSLDFKQIESDRARLVETLVGRLTTQALQELVDKSVAYRSGSMGYGEYYIHLSNVCQQNKVDLKKYGQLPAYINYVLGAEKIDKSSLITELDQLETNAQDALIHTEDERRLVADSRLLALMDKLIDHEMTPMEWSRYSSLRSTVQNLPARLETPTTPVPNLAPFEAFCSKAIARNHAMVDRLLGKMKADNATTALMVAGGFHTEGMTQLLKENQVSYVVLTPKIKDIPKDSDYLDVLARDPVPLENLITGEKIFLVQWLAMGEANTAEPGATAVQRAKEIFLKFEALLVGEINQFIVGKVMFRLSKNRVAGFKIGDQMVEAKKVDDQRAETMAHYAVESLYQAVPTAVAMLALFASGPVLSALVFIVSAHLFSRAFAMAHQTDRDNARKLYGLSLMATAGLFAALLFLPMDTFSLGQFDSAKFFPATKNFVVAFLSLTTLHTIWVHAIVKARAMVEAGSKNPLTKWVAHQPVPTISLLQRIKEIFSREAKFKRLIQEADDQVRREMTKRIKKDGATAYFLELVSPLNVSPQRTTRISLEVIETFEESEFAHFTKTYLIEIKKFPLEERFKNFNRDLLQAGEKFRSFLEENKGKIFDDIVEWDKSGNPVALTAKEALIMWLESNIRGETAVGFGTIHWNFFKVFREVWPTIYPKLEEFETKVVELGGGIEQQYLSNNNSIELILEDLKKSARPPRGLGSAGVTESLLKTLGIPSGSKSIGFTEGVPTGAFAGFMAAAPLLLAGALAAWMGVDLSALLIDHPFRTALVWAFLSVGGILGSRAVTKSALFALHQKTGVVMADGSLSFDVVDVRDATETAMSSFNPGAYIAPILASIALINPQLVGLSLSLMGGVALLSGIVHAVKNARIAKEDFKNKVKANRASVNDALRRFLGKQLMDSLDKPGRVIPYSLARLTPSPERFGHPLREGLLMLVSTEHRV